MKPIYFEKSLGIDFREESVALVFLGKKLKGTDVIASHFFHTGPLKDHPENEDAFVDEVRRFLKDFQVDPETVAVSLPRHLATVQAFTLPAPDRQTIDSMVGFELERHFATDLEELNVSYHVEQDTDTRFQITAVAIRKDILEYYMELVSKTGLSPTLVDCPTFGNLNLLMEERVTPGDVEVVLDLTSQSAEITILKDRRVQVTRNVPLNHAEFKEAYFQHDLSPDDFEKYAEELCNSLAQNIQTTLYTCKHISEDDSIERIHLFGGGEVAEPLSRKLEEDTGVLTQTALPMPVMRKDLPADYDPALMNGALALALRELRPLPYQINLLPASKKAGKKRASIRTTFVLSFIAALMIGGAITSQVTYNKTTLETLNQQLKAVKQEVGSLEKVDRNFDTMKEFANMLNAVDEKRPPKLPILLELGQVLPKDTYLTRISISKDKMEIQGYSSAASRLVPLIEASPYFHNTAVKGSIVNERNGEKFSIRSNLGKEAS